MPPPRRLLRSSGFTRLLPKTDGEERSSMRDDRNVPPFFARRPNRPVLTNGLRRAGSSPTGAWQLEDNGYVLPRPRAAAGAVSLRAQPRPSAVRSRSSSGVGASRFQAEGPPTESRRPLLSGLNDDSKLARAGLWRREGPHLPWSRRSRTSSSARRSGSVLLAQHGHRLRAGRARGGGRGRSPHAPGAGG